MTPAVSKGTVTLEDILAFCSHLLHLMKNSLLFIHVFITQQLSPLFTLLGIFLEKLWWGLYQVLRLSYGPAVRGGGYISHTSCDAVPVPVC